MEKLIEDDKLLTEFAKAIYKDVEKYINEYDEKLENTKSLDNI